MELENYGKGLEEWRVGGPRGTDSQFNKAAYITASVAYGSVLAD